MCLNLLGRALILTASVKAVKSFTSQVQMAFSMISFTDEICLLINSFIQISSFKDPIHFILEDKWQLSDETNQAEGRINSK